MVRLTDRLDITIAVDWDIKLQTNQTNSVYRFIGNGPFPNVKLQVHSRMKE